MDVFLLTSDLMIVAAVEGVVQRFRRQMRVVSTVEQLLDGLRELEATRLVLVDLSAAGVDPPTLVDTVRTLVKTKVGVVAFGPHVHAARLALARQAGCDEVLARGQFLGDLASVVKRYAPPRTLEEGHAEE